MAKQHLLTMQSLHVLDDGELESDFNDQLNYLVRDCIARSGIKKDREITLKIKIRPMPKPDGTCDDVEVQASTTSKCPNRPIEPYRMRATVNGGLKFQPDSPSNPDQQSLEFPED